ncbi:tetratricopeptide repeat protein [Palleronia caenipelagi]|uniref:Tetratricopeptide repeat protein n=1 Tax=Palleronia caenipelagi TaxID=2489174 RepID=A0A547Q5N5_9RHOB|nr:tetratricopeptide repeat protein [Palleronia caenipelagi]TRD21706.1 tetratricopeptide repeat protein [Palleronia caenipelagi]
MFRTLAATLALTLGMQAAEAQVAGPYLAGRQAQIDDSFASSADYLARAMAADPTNLQVLEALTGAYITLGQMDRAVEVGRKVDSLGATSQVANLARLSDHVTLGTWEELLAAMEDGLSVGPLFDTLVRGWALVGTGDGDAAIAAFDALSEEQDASAAFGIYYKALALAALGRFEEAEGVFADTPEMTLTRRGLLARAQILSQLDRSDEAREMLRAETGNNLDDTLGAAEAALADGPLPFTIIPDARAGVAEVSLDVANAVITQTAPSYAVLYSRLAEHLRPDLTDAKLMSAVLFEEMEQFDLAIAAYDSVGTDDPAHTTAQIGRADALSESGQREAATEALRALAKTTPKSPLVHITLGDMLREDGKFTEAEASYDKAIALFDRDERGQWVVYFARGIARERQGNWEGTEVDFQKALELNPGQPQVLNYLGYSLIERRERLDEALDLIEQAVKASPDAGYIVDSLAWGLYRLGRYEEAVEPMERAAALMPVDPVVNDHLGDVLWSVGRKLEAEFQWHRALSFIENDQNGDVDPDRIRRKLEIGLDAVLEEEAADAPEAANGG